jgi:ribosome-binding factor A
MKIIKVIKKSDKNENYDFGISDVRVSKDEDSGKVEISWYSAGSDKSIKNAEEHLKQLQLAIRKAKEIEKK